MGAAVAKASRSIELFNDVKNQLSQSVGKGQKLTCQLLAMLDLMASSQGIGGCHRLKAKQT